MDNAELIQRICKGMNMPQNRFASTFDISPVTVSRWISGKRTPKDETFKIILKRLFETLKPFLKNKIYNHITELTLASILYAESDNQIYRVALEKFVLYFNNVLGCDTFINKNTFK